MKEANRLRELYKYQVLDSPSEKKLDDIVEIASVLCDAPISLISLLDKDRQWFKAKKGISLEETEREFSFCDYILNSSDDVLVIDDLSKDDRFYKNPLVLKELNIRFYAGVPLKTVDGHFLGSLSILDEKPRSISKNKINALKLLANEVMEYLDTRKMLLSQSNLMERNSNDLRNFSGQSRSIFLQFEVNKNGTIDFGFLSEGLEKVHPALTADILKKHPKQLLDIIHPEDCDKVLKSIVKAFLNTEQWEMEFRIQKEDESISWYQGVAKPEKREREHVIWYGTFHDISHKMEYVNALEQMSFDISHVLRKPVTTLMSIISVIEIEKELDEEALRMYAGYLKSIGEELDGFTKMLNDTYHNKWIRLNE